jgi:hypothetical protein
MPEPDAEPGTRRVRPHCMSLDEGKGVMRLHLRSMHQGPSLVPLPHSPFARPRRRSASFTSCSLVSRER